MKLGTLAPCSLENGRFTSCLSSHDFQKDNESKEAQNLIIKSEFNDKKCDFDQC